MHPTSPIIEVAHRWVGIRTTRWNRHRAFESWRRAVGLSAGEPIGAAFVASVLRSSGVGVQPKKGVAFVEAWVAWLRSERRTVEPESARPGDLCWQAGQTKKPWIGFLASEIRVGRDGSPAFDVIAVFTVGGEGSEEVACRRIRLSDSIRFGRVVG